MSDKIKLKGAEFCHINFAIYGNDFTFIVNGNQYETSKFFADYLSPIVARLHNNDPSINTFSINLSNNNQDGNFQEILDLANFVEYQIPQNERLFFAEVFEIIGSESIELKTEEESITLNNVFDRIQLHEKYENYYQKILQEEIDFVSGHFYEINQNQEQLLGTLKESTIEKIINNSKLQLKTNDQLIGVINDIYRIDPKYAKLYEFVDFADASNESINNFASHFDINDLTAGSFAAILNRFKCTIINNTVQSLSINRIDRPYPKKFYQNIEYQHKNDFNGIITYFKNHSNGNVFEFINIEASPSYSNSESYSPKNVILYDDTSKNYWSQNQAYAYIIFDFKDHRIKPTFYTIRTDCNLGYFLKSFYIQGSNDKNQWDIIDEINECYQLNTYNRTYTFAVQKQIETEYRYIRLYQTNTAWNNQWYLALNAIEFYGNIL